MSFGEDIVHIESRAFDKSNHEQYFEALLCAPPTQYASMDVQRVTLLFFALNALNLMRDFNATGMDAADVIAFFAAARSLGRRFLAEQLVRGEEISVPVLGNAGYDLEALTPIGIYPVDAEFFDYDVKYDAARCEELVPPRGLDAAMIERVQELAIVCHEALQCDGLSRTDMIVTDDGPVVLEVNTMPGFTTESLFPKAAAGYGIAYPELLARLLDLALMLPTRKETLS